MHITITLVFKILGSFVSFLSTPLIYTWLQLKDSVTGWDYGLIKKIDSIPEDSDITVTNTTSATINTKQPNHNLTITTSQETSSNTFTFELKITNSNEVKEIHEKMKHWECKLKGSGIEDEITKLKESFGIKTNQQKFQGEHKISLIRFISSCASRGKPWRPKQLSANGTENNKLSREVDVDSSSIKNFYYISQK